MSFLNKLTDMSETVFKSVNVQKVKAFLVSVFDRCRPGWIAEPVGEIGRMWNGDSEPEHRDLVVLGLILDRLQHTVTKRSEPFLRSKVNELLGSSGYQYRELRAELQFAADLSLKHHPISLAPFVPAEVLGTGRENASPDYGIRTADGDITFEVTSFYLESFERWDRVTSQLRDRLFARLKRQNSSRSVVLGLPVAIRSIDIDSAQLNQLADRIAAAERGNVTLQIRGGGVVQWEPLPHLISEDITSPEQVHQAMKSLPPGSVAATVGSGLACGVVLAQQPRGVDASIEWVISTSGPPVGLSVVRVPQWKQAEEIVYKSLKNTLKTKREQYPEDDQPYILVVRIGHNFIQENMFMVPLNRFWHSRAGDKHTYGWLSAVVFYEPMKIIATNTPGYRAQMVINPNARHPVPQSFIDLLSRPNEKPIVCPQ